MRSLFLMLACAGTIAGPVQAQMDPTMAGQGAVLTEMNRRNAERLTGRRVNPYGTQASVGVAAKSDCSDVAALKTRLGSLSRAEYARYYACTHPRP